MIGVRSRCAPSRRTLECATPPLANDWNLSTVIPARLLLPMSLSLLLAACSGEPAPEAGTESGAASPAARFAYDPGLLLDPLFATPGQQADEPLQHWKLSQHAGESSYELRLGDGEIVLLRTASQPWGLLQQSLDASHLAGKTLEFSVEISAELTDEWGPPMSPTGLSVSVMGFGTHDLPMMGKRSLLELHTEPGLGPGKHDRRRHSLRFEMPEGRELELQVGILLTHGGSLNARGPSLRVIED
jgi:hypothetical protein